MLNSHSQINKFSNNIEINAVSGSILKNHPKSWFEWFDLESTRANALMVEGGHKGNHNTYGWREHGENDIIILQMILCDNSRVIAECVYKKDFNGDPDEK